jgi:hypothetical protein
VCPPWTDYIDAERLALNRSRTVDPHSMQNDRLLAKISDCRRFLNALLLSGAFYRQPELFRAAYPNSTNLRDAMDV